MDTQDSNGHLPELLERLRSLWVERFHAVRARWARSLPMADYVVDRWEKARLLGFGEGTSIFDSSLVIGDVVVGRNTWIGPNTVLDGSGGLHIGDHCSISAGVQVYTHDTIEWSTSGGVAAPKRAPVHIGNRCYVGPHVVISKGVTIGDGAVIGAMSFVNRDIPAGAKAWGCPAMCQS